MELYTNTLIVNRFELKIDDPHSCRGLKPLNSAKIFIKQLSVYESCFLIKNIFIQKAL